MKGTESREVKQKKVAGWSTQMLEEVTSKRELVQWTSINQEEVNRLVDKNCAGKWRRKSERSTKLKSQERCTKDVDSRLANRQKREKFSASEME